MIRLFETAWAWCVGRGRGGSGQAGFALLAALLVSTLLAAIGTSFVVETRTASLSTRNDIDASRARALADAGIRFAVIQLMGPTETVDGASLRPDGQPLTWRFGGGTVGISVHRESGKTNLNNAKQPVLKSLFIKAGAPERRAQDLAAAIITYRRTDGLMDEHNASGDPDAMRLRMSWDYDNRPFDTVEEMLLVPGVTRTLYDKLVPALTVWGGRTKTDDGNTSNVGAGEAVTIMADAALPGGARFTRRAIVEFTSSASKPYIVREWR